MCPYTNDIMRKVSRLHFVCNGGNLRTHSRELDARLCFSYLNRRPVYMCISGCVLDSKGVFFCSYIPDFENQSSMSPSINVWQRQQPCFTVSPLICLMVTNSVFRDFRGSCILLKDIHGTNVLRQTIV